MLAHYIPKVVSGVVNWAIAVVPDAGLGGAHAR